MLKTINKKSVFRSLTVCLVLTLLAGLVGCQKDPDATTPQARILRIATTTSVDNTGLMALLVKPFEQRYGVTVQILAVGSGQALRLGRNGDVDMVLTHDPDAEKEFVEQGWGILPKSVMHNDFVVVGPAQDPADVKSAPTPEQALARIAAAKAPFVSRGDKSGTHLKELALWKLASIEPSGDWYVEAGQGQRLTLEMADQKGAYALVDRATLEVSKAKLKVVALYHNPDALRNPYSVIVVSPGAQPQTNVADALAFVGYLLSAEGQAIISGFQVDGRTLFVPEVLPKPVERAP